MSNIEPVKFGTDGWRAVIAENYTFANVCRVALATTRVFKNHNKIQNGIFIGYDTRFLSKEFAHAAAEMFCSQGIKTFLASTFVTTPTVSLITRDKKLAFGVMITASHNPFQYNGFKLKDEFGGSMNPTEIVKVEAELENIKEVHPDYDSPKFIDDGILEYFDGMGYYKKYLGSKIDFDAIKKADLNIAFDAMYGAGQNIIKEFIPVTQLHGEINPSFGNFAPEPVAKNLGEICNLIKNGKFNLGIVTDGDADRIAIIDEKGEFLDAQKTFVLLLKYLSATLGLKGKVVRGFSGTDLLKRYCDKYGLELITVPIGFKHISKIMIEDDVLIGAEESGGIGIQGHLPERDGIYNGCLYAEMLAKTGKSISELKKELDDEFGCYFYNRIDVHTTNDLKNATLEKCKTYKVGDEIAGKKITMIDPMDGTKFSFDNGWITVRASGTEPLLRFYCETSGTDETLDVLNKAISNFNLK